MAENLKVVDLFCGGGGFSEGFRQAGLEISHAVDYDSGACSTYELNMPDETKVLQRNLLSEISPSDLPQDTGIVIGSPPCTEFSRSKQGGKGDKEKGKSTVRRFFEFVDYLDPKYWLMENVPNSRNHIKEAFESSSLSDKEDINPDLHILDSNEYGTPQRRSRLFFGEFPEPVKSSENPLKLGEVVEWSPDTRKENLEGTIQDPLYTDIELNISNLTDHFYDSFLTDREAKEVRLKKEDHSYYGRMSFPDNPEKACRTILASRRKMARETVVVGEDSPPNENRSRFRELTVRESAVVQGFPITYQFQGSSLKQKWRRVGDAVPPTVAYRIALAILEKEGMDVCKKSPNVNQEVNKPQMTLDERGTRSRRRLPLTRTFQHHVPYDNKREFRVDLANEKQNPPKHPLSDLASKEFFHPVRFKVILTEGYAGEHRSEEVSFLRAKEMIASLFLERPDLRNQIRNFLARVSEDLGPKVPDATTLQASRSRRADFDDLREYELLETIAKLEEDEEQGIVDEVFPRSDFEGDRIKIPNLMGGIQLPVRVLVKVFAANYVAYKLNYCSDWINWNTELVHIPEDFDLDKSGFPEQIPCSSSALYEKCIDQKLHQWMQPGESHNELNQIESVD